MKKKEKQKAIFLRRRGNSLKEISDKLHISKSTASLWSKGVILNSKSKLRLQKRMINGRITAVQTNKKRKRELLDKIIGGVHSFLNNKKDLEKYKGYRYLRDGKLYCSYYEQYNFPSLRTI